MRKPNLFIVGAPKCGTTALYEYLRAHPAIFMSWPKEPHHFAPDIRTHIRWDTPRKYLKLFEKASEQHTIVGEASVWYLYSKVAIKTIRAFNPHARIIAMVRNPLEMIHAVHAQLLYSFQEDQQDFEVAWTLQPARKRGMCIPRTCRDPVCLQYAQVGKMGEQIERLLRIMPKKQVKIILFDDFKKDARAVYEDVLSFLGVPGDGRMHFPRINENKRHCSWNVGRFVQRPPKIVKALEDSLKRITGIERSLLLGPLRRLNNQKTKRKPLSPAIRAQLAQAFHDDVEKLSRILKQDLSHWL